MSEEFVTIELSRKQVIVDKDHPIHNEKTGKDYARVLAPGGGSFLYPIDSLKVNKENPDRMYFQRPVGTEIQVQYSYAKDGVASDAPNSEKYETSTRVWKIEDLKAAYDEKKQQYAEKMSAFVNMTVPTEWGKEIHSEKGDFISIAIPIEPNKYYSFIIPADKFMKSENNEGMSYFGFPKKKKDSDEDFTVTLLHEKKREDGSIEKSELKITSTSLKKYVDDALGYANIKELFVSTEISSKLVRNFKTNDDRELCSIAVPVTEQDGKEVFYEIVVPAERVKQLEDGKCKLSLFKNNSNGEEYVFTAKHSVSNDQGGYDETSIKLTSSEVIGNFERSKEAYAMNHTNSDHSLGDEIRGDVKAPVTQQNVQHPRKPHIR